ncbi:MAG: hypothetical protein CL764_04745 [Chloroflexi bacterium]|nr:hypothetical protein [Chloroflexota bacterium]
MSPNPKLNLEEFLPDFNKDLIFKQINGVVDIYRDSWGIPHIKAKDEFDLFFAQGFATAQDRLWHMDFDRHRALGKSSELLGYEMFDNDQLVLKIDVLKASKLDYECSSDLAKKMLNSYTNGVNAFIESTNNFPVEYSLLNEKPKSWNPWDCISVYKIRNMFMGTYEMKLLKTKVFKELGEDLFKKIWGEISEFELLTIPPNTRLNKRVLRDINSLSESVNLLNYLKESDIGSNAWVISGDRTKSGLPLIAGDSHRALDTPSVYYQVHLECEKFAVSGYSIPGLPGAPHFSHTEYLAYGMTHGNADYQDLFLEKFRENGKNLEYFYKNRWLKADLEIKSINVKNGKKEFVEVVKTNHGSVISGNPRSGYGLIFSHTGTNSGTKWVDTVYQILHAKNSDQLIESLEEWTEPVNNFVFADIRGKIGYKLRGKIPVRNSDNHKGIVSGWDGNHDWKNFIPYYEMPSSVNPNVGYIVTCNQRVVGPDFPYYIGDDFRPAYRASRIITRILELPEAEATVENMSQIHSDRLSIPASILFKKLLEMDLFSKSQNDLEKLIKQWDFVMSPDSKVATLYSMIRKTLIEESLNMIFGNLIDKIDSSEFSRAYDFIEASIYSQLINQINGGSKFINYSDLEKLLKISVNKNLGNFEKKFHEDNLESYKWGKVHKTNPKHPLSTMFPEYASFLNPPNVSMGGDSDTPQQGGYLENFEVNSVSVNRYIHDVSDWKKSRWIVPLGASGHPGSPHFSDQSKLWSNLETIPQLWDWDEIKSSAESHQSLTPS